MNDPGEQSNLLDSETLEGLHEVGDAEFVKDLLETYLASANKCLASISTAFDASETDQLRRVAHTFKGASGNVGATQLAETCRKLEVSAGQSLEGAAEIIGQVQREFEQVKAEVQDQIEACG